MELPILPATWSQVVASNRNAVLMGWASAGVFGTGVGPDYEVGRGLLYIGKSAGPLGGFVGSGDIQSESCKASVNWMISRSNKSPFWQFADRIDFTRRSIAWSNVCKMDVVGGGRPPSPREWSQVASICMTALKEEIEFLRPRVTVFATSGLYGREVAATLTVLGFASASLPFNDGRTTLLTNASGQSIFLTKHPQGWQRSERDRVIGAVQERLSS